MEDIYYRGDFEPARKEAEKLHNEMGELRAKVLFAKGQERLNIMSDISKKKAELHIINNKMEYHRLNAFIDVAKGMIEKELYIKIWEEVNKVLPEIIISGRKSKL